MSQNAMTVDYKAIADDTVAIAFPQTGRPPLLRSSYQMNEKQWTFMIKEAFNNKVLGAMLIKENSEEGRAIVQGTTPEHLTESYLLSLEMPSLKNLAKRYQVKVSGRSTQRSLVLGILSAVENGVEPDAEVAE